jgi:ribosomal protein L37E
MTTSTVRCANCGNSVPRAKFCNECGVPLAVPSAASAATVPTPAAAPPASSPRAAPGTVRAWLRSLDRGGGHSVGVRPEHVVEVAAALRVVRDEQLLSEDAFKAVQNQALRFPGAGGTVWTVGLGSLRWNVLREGKWELAEAPPWVWLEAPVRPRTSPARAAPPRVPARVCTHCGRTIAAGKKFCTACGTPVDTDRRTP